MVKIRILYRGHSWCIILLNWGVANIAAYPNNQKNCSDGYYWDNSAQEPGKPDNGLAHCAKCSELCEFILNLEILLSYRECHDVKECRAVLNNTFIGRCQNGFIYDIITELCVDCEYMCTDEFMQHGMEGICRQVCGNLQIENITIIANGTSDKTIATHKVYITVGLIIGGITIVVLITVYCIVLRKRKRKRNCRKFRSISDGNISDSVSGIQGLDSSQNICKFHETDTHYCKANGVGGPAHLIRLGYSGSRTIMPYENRHCAYTSKRENEDSNTEDIMTTTCSNDDLQSVTLLSNDSEREQPNMITTPPTGLNGNAFIPNGNTIHNTYQKIPTNTEANKLSYKDTDNRTTTYVSETPVIMDILNDEEQINGPADTDIMLSYTSELATNRLTSTSYRDGRSYSSDMTSIKFNNRTHLSMTGMSLYSYNQPDSYLSYEQHNTNDCSTSEKTHSSVYSFKETVFTDDDLKAQCDQNDKNAPHIKGEEEHGNLTADEIEQLPKDLSDVPDIQNKLQHLAQKQYVKRIISNGRYIRAWYDALDQTNAERFIGQILGVSKDHFDCEYVYNNKA